MSSTFLTAAWRKLIMAQYAVDPAILQPHLPGGLELDLYEDPASPNQPPQCFVSLVGFLFDRVRLKRIPVPFHTRFEEVNLRFYVKRHLPDGTFRRGVVFLSEIVPKAAITLTARALYGEAYRTAATRHLWRTSPASATTPPELDISYAWQLPRPRRSNKWQHLSVQASATPTDIAPGSLEEFITEHYWGYTLHTGLIPRRGATGEYGVAHPRWQVYPIRSAHVAADFAALYGPAFAALTDRAPDHVLLAEGSPIAIRSGSHFTAPDM
jgi:uncharacterized protein YqjF (DUF2071 family)